MSLLYDCRQIKNNKGKLLGTVKSTVGKLGIHLLSEW